VESDDDQKGKETRLVVNCSLVINVPRLNHRITDLDPRILAKIVREWEKHKDDPIEYLTSEFLSTAGESWLAHQGLAIEWICDLIYVLGSRVIAAARNDWDNHEPRADTPQVRYPAAFDSTLGVGILPKGEIAIQATSKRAASNYPNLSDQPESIGIMTLGGEAEEKPGVRGVYIGKFPPSSDKAIGHGGQEHLSRRQSSPARLLLF